MRNPHDEFVIPIVEELCRRLPPKSGRKHMNASALAGYDETSERENKDGSSWDPHNENPDSGADGKDFQLEGKSQLCFGKLSLSANTTANRICQCSSGLTIAHGFIFVSVPPFEFRALEVALEAICSFLDARTTELETNAYPALDELTKKVDQGFSPSFCMPTKPVCL